MQRRGMSQGMKRPDRLRKTANPGKSNFREHRVDVSYRKGVPHGCANRRKLLGCAVRGLAPLGRFERSADPFSSRHMSRAGNSLNFTVVGITENYLKPLTHVNSSFTHEDKPTIPRFKRQGQPARPAEPALFSPRPRLSPAWPASRREGRERLARLRTGVTPRPAG